jgi:tetratricopeptide (TPR) repeat protein
MPKAAPILDGAIAAHTRLGDSDRVLALFDTQIALAPEALKPKADKALYLQQIGAFEAAETILRDLLKRAPEETELYRMLIGGTKLAASDPLLKQMRRLWKDKRLNDHGRVHLGFALARVAEEQGEIDRVFPYLDAANAAQKRLAPFDAAERTREWEAFAKAQDGADFTPLNAPLPVSPVFVTGMPRSGTTLVEQIVAAQSTATAGGEMGHALREAVRVFGPPEQMPLLASLGSEALGRWADRYMTMVRRDTTVRTGTVTDKSIQSQLIFGLIARGLPGARIIVVQRDPRDVALSIYKNHFAIGRHRYANDLRDIAETIKLFHTQVRFWEDRMPERIARVRYEDLVSDPEPQARALIAAAGLDWEDACLDFHTQKSKVRTLSLAQVRQPIHAGRREAWRRYEAELAPFIDAWGDTPWD